MSLPLNLTFPKEQRVAAGLMSRLGAQDASYTRLGCAFVNQYVLVPIRRMANGAMKTPLRLINCRGLCFHGILVNDQPGAIGIGAHGPYRQMAMELKGGDLAPIETQRFNAARLMLHDDHRAPNQWRVASGEIK